MLYRQNSLDWLTK